MMHMNGFMCLVFSAFSWFDWIIDFECNLKQSIRLWIKFFFSGNIQTSPNFRKSFGVWALFITFEIWMQTKYFLWNASMHSANRVTLLFIQPEYALECKVLTEKFDPIFVFDLTLFEIIFHLKSSEINTEKWTCLISQRLRSSSYDLIYYSN